MSSAWTWQRQGVIFVLAMVVALYQVNKTGVFLQKADAIAETQMEKAMGRVGVAVRDAMFYRADSWMPARGGRAAASSTGDKSMLIIGSTAMGTETPVLRGELFIDPVQRRKKLESGSKGGRRSPRAAYHQSQKNKGGRHRDPQEPLLAFRVFDPSLLPLAKDLERLGLVARIIAMGDASEKGTAEKKHLLQQQDQGREKTQQQQQQQQGATPGTEVPKITIEPNPASETQESCSGES